MKYLKLFEQKGNKDSIIYWMMDYCIKSDNAHTYILFPDIKSVENYIIEIINSEREALEDDNYNNTMYFIDVKEAFNWYEKTFNDIDINYYRLDLKEVFEGSEKLKRMRDIKKYNL